MKVAVASHGRFHAFELARGLAQRDLLAQLHTTYPKSYVRAQTNLEFDVDSAWPLEVLRRGFSKLGMGQKTDLWIIEQFSRRLAKHIASSRADILVGWSSSTLDAMATARSKDMKVVIERGSTHIGFQTRLLEQAYLEHGTRKEITPPEIIERELAEYERADAISVPSSVAAKSFASEGIAAEKILVNPLGIDTTEFKAITRPPLRNRPARIVFVGEIGLRKGAHILLAAFEKLERDAELILAGRISADFEKRVREISNPRIQVLPPVPRPSVASLYEKGDIYCQPSIEEGFGMAVTEAMATGLPAVVSDATGAIDILTPESDSLVFRSGSVDDLAAALIRLIDDPDLIGTMGEAAVKNMAAQNGWLSYVERAIANYRDILQR